MIKFYICDTCGNLIEKIEDSGLNPTCCNRPMIELRPASTDGTIEKHVPVITIGKYCEGLLKVIIDVGSTPHPMAEFHHIQFITLETDKGSYRRFLSLLEDPCAVFYISSEENVVAAYAYCNLHGLWVREML